MGVKGSRDMMNFCFVLNFVRGDMSYKILVNPGTAILDSVILIEERCTLFLLASSLHDEVSGNKDLSSCAIRKF